MSDKILEQVKAVVTQQLDVSADAVVLSAVFTEDLNADSLDVVEMVMALEEEFDIDIPDEEAEKIKTVEDAVNFIKANS